MPMSPTTRPTDLSPSDDDGPVLSWRDRARQWKDNPALYRQAREEARRLAPLRWPHLFDPDPPWRGPPGHHQCLEPDGEVRWVPDTPHHERQRALGKTLMAQGMPDEAIETILWMDNERHPRDSDADAEPVEPPPARTRKRKPDLVTQVKRAVAAGLNVRSASISESGVVMTFGEPEAGDGAVIETADELRRLI
jgi:hypothetical protein